jgi:ferric-dicitrate binding protein FerR (iron transport regulator)
MKERMEIEKLLERFHQGVSTPDENLELLRYLDKNSAELDRLAQKVWEENYEVDESVSGAEVLKLLHQKLGFVAEEKKTKVSAAKVVRLILRYAAVLVIGFGLAWYFIVPRNNQSKDTDSLFYKVTVAYGSKSTIELPDGSVVTLNSGSTLKYPGSFASTSRTVILDGEAFFDVKKNPSSPFLVKTKDITVRVLGTKFNVKSYPDENLTETTLVTGKVEILRNHTNEKTSVIEQPLVLIPNQKAVFYRESNQLMLNNSIKQTEENVAKDSEDLKVLVQSEIKTENVTSWKNNILVFNSEPFDDIVKKLERWYDVEVILKYSRLGPVVFSGKFDKESVEEVLHALSLIEPFKYEVNKNKILIYK